MDIGDGDGDGEEVEVEVGEADSLDKFSKFYQLSELFNDSFPCY